MSRVYTKRDDWTPWYNQVKAELAKLAAMEIHVGIMGDADSMILTIARVHEYGAIIRPSKSRNLAIPLKPEAREKSPRDFADSFVFDNGENRFIVQSKGKNQLNFLFLLLPSVTIPERSFIRAGYDTNKNLLVSACENAVRRVILGELSADQAAHNIGIAAVNMIKRYMRTVQPPKSDLTLASAPGKTTPLFQSGSLYQSISYEVVT